MDLVDTFDRRSVLRQGSEIVGDLYSLDHQRLALQPDFSRDLGRKVSFCQRNAARLQRASKGAGQSPAGGCYDVVECRRLRRKGGRIDSVVLRNLGVDTEHRRLSRSRKIGSPHGSFDAFDTDARGVDSIF